MGYQKIYRFFSEECLKKKRKGKGKCKYHGGELEGEFRFIENFLFKMNPLQFQVTTTATPTATRTHIGSEDCSVPRSSTVKEQRGNGVNFDELKKTRTIRSGV